MPPADAGPAFGALLRHHRLAAGLTQEALAERAGLSARTVQSLEGGGTRPYRDTTERLIGALGLTEEERAALRAAAGGRRGDRPPPGGPRKAPLPSNLPAPRTALIGREQEVARVREALAGGTTRLLTVTGVGGAGKTSVALQAARELRDAPGGPAGGPDGAPFPDGVWLVELAPLADPDLVPQAVADVLGVRDAPGTAVMEALAAFLRPRRVLLLLDNCEHLVEACAALAGHLLDTCPGLRLLATGRESLQLAGEQRLRLPPLAAPGPAETAEPGGPGAPAQSVAELARYPAVRLFLERARAADDGFALTAENAAQVAQVCASLGGIPLALELAAARVPVLTPGQLVTRLDDALRLLTGGSRAGPTRQQTMRAALDWSHDLLAPAERALFRRLAVFAGDFDLAAAEAVGGPEPGAQALPEDVLDVLGRLVEKSLLVVGAGGDAGARYRLLEPVRQYAVQRLGAAGEEAPTRDRHGAYFLALAEAAAPALRGPKQIAWLSRLDLEQDNLRAALRWLAGEGGGVRGGGAEGPLGRGVEPARWAGLLRLAVAAVPFWEVRGHLSEGRHWLDIGLAVGETGGQAGQLRGGQGGAPDAALRARALTGAGRLAFWQTDLDQAAARLEESSALARACGDAGAEAEARTWLGAVWGASGNFALAAPILEEGRRLSEAAGDEWSAAWALLSLGRAQANNASTRAEVVVGAPSLEESWRRFGALGDIRCRAIAAVYLGATLAPGGNWERVAGLIRQGLAGLQAVGDRAYLFPGLLTLAWVASLNGDAPRAARLMGAAEGAAEALGATLAPVNRKTQRTTLQIIRRQMDEPALEAARAAGQALPVEQAIAEAWRPPLRIASGTAGTAGALTPREREVVDLLVQGHSDRAIGDALGIATGTANVHVRNVLAKLGLRSRWQVREERERAGRAGAPAAV